MRSLVTSVVMIAAVLGSSGAAAAAAKPTLKFTKIQYDAPGADTRANSQLNKEYVVLRNTGRKAVQLKNWTLRDAQRHVYRFPAFKLRPGRSVTIHTGKGRNNATHLYMNRGWYIWNNDQDTATLRDARGVKALARSWSESAPPKPSPSTDPRYGTCTEAKANGYGPYYEGRDPEYHWYSDRDGDGVVCE
ncbi:lamin tail domain-containing protein [Actinocorallia populi]|uniref:lamin tail domain-containing protein n=1 Tax=Actinocorallia populi TaxID=2079200 RepID=UPI0013001DFB|nr:lamin tail domain-containing protein [Actinocorallia populi]